MTADKQFNRWMRRAFILFLVVFAYIVIADVTIPMTPHSQVQRPVITVASRVAGEVTQVYVTNNQRVAAGDLLFEIDPSDYELAVEKAELALSNAKQINATLQAQLAQVQASVKEASVSLKQSRREYERMQRLLEKQLVSQQVVDQHETNVSAAEARLAAAKQNQRAVQADLGDDGELNLRLRQARNALAKAQLNLSRTQVVAPKAGVISNLQLVAGIQSQANQPLMSLVVEGQERIAADFREKSLSHIPQHAHALVVFDALPGQVFSATLRSRDMGIAQGQDQADGLLAQPDNSDRWVRDAQRIRVYVKLDDATLPVTLATGARATVMLESDSQGWAHALSRLQMTIVSYLHYVY
ncbi:HlyD family secretion protein [Salinimonas sp. HHU 13199]|uniref:HlyD family secretion protein n=1 Tax=Salinimonas profundi TaxID=2729140 RepID=A0ABR8LL39_9ALTE|nr:HlyD family secretion protein [Salinimonas profundi]MBD3586035.1 HlyD family secretion protein [Salinimonas profundi]